MSLTFTDSSTPLNAANLNLTIAGDGTGYFQILGFHIRYTGATWSAYSQGSTDQTGNLSYAFASSTLTITISGIDNPYSGSVMALVTRGNHNTAHFPLVSSSDATQIDVKFGDNSDPTSIVSSADTQMNFHILIFGKIAA